MFLPSEFSVKLTPMGSAVPLHFAINLVPHLNGNRYIWMEWVIYLRRVVLVKARDAMNCRLYNNQFFVLTAIYRIFSDL
ncbi:MAG: hypothetical protein V7K41_25935 [Nostoc sp.]|uniref:hypothetical protein n=1 Tax=Nostoc sp. TaxID=1180 RepID=UPI002FF7DC91